MVFDRTLNWDLHVNSIVSTIFFKLRKLYQIKNLLPQEARLRLVRALILPHLYYGNVIFFNAPKSCFKKLQKAINACTRFVYNIPGRTSPGRFRNVILGRFLQNHFKYHVCIFIFKLLKFKEPGYLYNSLRFSSSTRCRNLLLAENQSAHYNGSFFVRGISIWNSLPISIRTVSGLGAFKSRVLDYFK
jgi:hypothetical protein